MPEKVFGLTLLLGISGWLLTPAPAQAWGKEGHVIVAKIAELNLTDKAKKEIRKLLGPIPISESRIANFADFVRHNPDHPEFSDSAPWHFVDIPYDAAGYDPERDCKGGKCVVDRIEEFKKVLAGDSPSQDRLNALMFLVHLVGDLHQPLHCTTRNDRGGNDLQVLFLGKKGNHLNLHSVWDSNLVLASLGGLDPLDFANRANMLAEKKDRAEWLKGGPIDWANESHQIAKIFAYVDSQGNVLPTKGAPNLDQEYVTTRSAQVALQLRKGGIRLAKVLNDTFGK